MKTRIFSLIYFAIGTFFIITHNLHLVPVAFISKVLIIPPLMVILVLNLKLCSNRLHRIMFAGLFFSWAGDVLLEIPGGGEVMFMAGLGGFLTSLVLFAVAFFSTPGRNEIFHRRAWLIVPGLLYGLVMGIYLSDYLGEMLIPVIIYETVMIIMLTAAISRIGRVNRESFYLVLAGAILFVISDSILAVNKFAHPVALSTILIMGTYLLAEWLITMGYIRQFSQNWK
jgi:uncharacterized membrane protein YhhN